MPIVPPTTGEIDSTQGFRKVPLPALKYAKWVGTAPKASPNPYTGLPVKRKGKVLTVPSS